MHKILFFLILLLSFSAQAGGLQASFTGVPNSPCDVTCDQYSVACYDGETDGSGNLIDKSGENLYSYSEDQTQADWSKTRATVPSCNTASPDGYAACIVHEDSTLANSHYIYRLLNFTVNEKYFISFDIKKANRIWFEFTHGTQVGINVDLENCKFGTTDGYEEKNIIPLSGDWCRVSFSWIEDTGGNLFDFFRAGEADNDVVFDGLDQDSFYISAVRLISEDRGNNRYIATEAATKPWHDLAPTNAPGYVQGDFQRQDGSRIAGRSFLNASSQYYSKADHDSLDIFDGDHTLITVIENYSSASGSTYEWAKGSFQVNGAYFYMNHGNNTPAYRFNKSGATCDAVFYATDTSDDKIHIIQGTRKDDVVTVYYDGDSGTPVDCSGYGSNSGAAFAIGSSSGGTSTKEGDFHFLSIQRRALSPHELSSQREQLLGILSSQKTLGATNVIVDGDMEAAGVGSWTSWRSAALSKTTENIHQGKQSLRVTYGGQTNPAAYQTITSAGKKYRITGYARGNGTASPSIQVSTIGLIWAGTTSTSWQNFDVTFTAVSTGVYLYASALSAGDWSEFDDVYVYEYDDSQWTFSRTTDAFQTFSTGTISEIAEEIPRVGGKGGGLLIEGQSTNLLEYSHDFTSGWTPVRSSVPSCTGESPELNNDRACILHEDGTASQTHYITDTFSVTSGTTYTTSLYAKAINRDWVRLSLGGGTLNAGIYVNLNKGTIDGTHGSPVTYGIEPFDNDWYKIWVSSAASSTGSGSVLVYVNSSGDAAGSTFNGLDQDSIYLYGIQSEEGSFPTSLIDTGGAGPVTRTADSMTIDPHPAVGRKILPEEFDEEGVLTIEFDAKCEWSGAADIGTNRRLLEISGNTGTAAWNRNRLVMEVQSSGRIYFRLFDDSNTDKKFYSAIDVVDYSEWHTYKFKLDLSDMSQMDGWIDGSSSWTFDGNSSASTFDTTNVLIRIGQQYDDTINGFCQYRNLRIEPSEF